MPKKYPTLTPQEVIEILKANKFICVDTIGSHAQYVGFIKGEKKRVTVDIHYDNFNPDLLKSMIWQSGLSREDFYSSTKSTAKKINKKFREDLK